MRVWTVHTKAGKPPVLVPEGFTWGGLVFGPLWLLAERAWVAGLIALCLDIALSAARIGPYGAVLGAGLSWAIGLFGQDLRRWSLERAGYTLVNVVADRTEDAALSRLLERRPDLLGDALIGEVVQ